MIWTALAIGIWFGIFEGNEGMLEAMSAYTPAAVEGERPPFLTPDKLLIYIYMAVAGFSFAVIWMFLDKNKWSRWSVLGSTIIMLVTYYNVQISVFLNDWYGGFYDLLQKALSEAGAVSLNEFYSELLTVAPILLVNITVLVLLDFFVSHYVFRWRTAMNNYFMDHWAKLRHIEGAAQRVQEDTQRFARIVEGLGVSFVRSMMTLIAFLPLLYTLSEKVTELPFFGPVDGAMVYVAIMSALLGTVLLAIVGIKLPGLEFNNQKVEAAYRKELVYGEDREDRAQPATVRELYEGVRKNYYRLYFNYLYFNVARFAYLQGSSFIPFIALGPTIVSGTITLGIFTQINNAFDRVEESFKFFANVWTTIIDLISIYKRLISFEKIIYQDEDTQSGATSAPAE
jgi:peptide/bleomycin uptake transporter